MAVRSPWELVFVRQFRAFKVRKDECHKRGTTKDEKGWAVSEMIDDLASSQPTQRGADPPHRCDGTLGMLVATGASHDIGDH